MLLTFVYFLPFPGKKACDSTFESVTRYDHSQTGAWNAKIIVIISLSFPFLSSLLLLSSVPILPWCSGFKMYYFVRSSEDERE